VINGGGASSRLTISGFVALSGSYTTGALAVGSGPLPGTAVVGGLALGAGSGVIANTVTIADGNISLNGAGANLLASGTVTIGQPSGLSVPSNGSFTSTFGSPGTLAVAGGATVTAQAGIAVGEGLLSVIGVGSAIGITGDLTIGTEFPSNPVAPYTYFNSGSLIVENGASIAVSGSVISLQDPIQVVGTGSALRAGGMLVVDASTSNGTDLSVFNAATVQVNGILIQQLYQGTVYGQLIPAVLIVDQNSVLEVGSAGGAVAGALTVDSGQSLLATTSATIVGDIVNNGSIGETGTSLTVQGSLTPGGASLLLLGSIVNNGIISIGGGTLTLDGTLSGSGVIDIGTSAALAMSIAATAGGSVDFDGSGATLIVSPNSNSLPPIGTTLSGFAEGDVLLFPGTSLTKATWAASGADTGILSLFNGALTAATYTIAGNYTGEAFTVSPTTGNGAAITVVTGGIPTDATVAQALASYAANPNLDAFNITDTALAVQINLDALEPMAGAITEFSLTDSGTPALSITWPQLGSDAAVLALVSGSYTLVVNGVPVAAVAAVEANPRVASFSISDSPANVVANIAALQTLAVGGQLTSIALTAAGTPGLGLTVAQLSADTTVLGRIAGPYNVLVTDTAPVGIAGFDLAATSGGTGQVTVIGSQAVVTNTGGFVVGDAGVGSLSILSGGTVAGESGLVIANSAGAAGSSVIVSGIGSQLNIRGALDMGVAGSGVLQIAGGGTVTADLLDAGVSADAVANIGLSGAGTEFSVTGAATVADNGTGVLSVLAGATFTAASLTIGNAAGSSGALVVSGTGSAIDLSGALNIGTASGTGDLTVGPGAGVHAAVVNLQGQVVLEGGLLDPTVQIINQGQTAGGFGTITAGDIIDEGVVQAGASKASQKLLLVEGTVLGGGTLTINGTVQGSNPNGVLQINAGGTMELTGAVLNAATTTFTDNLTPSGMYTVNNGIVDVTFADAAGVLVLDDISEFAGTISMFHTGDSFVISGGTLAGLGVSNGDTLTVQDGAEIDQIIFGSAISASGFGIVNGNTIQVACFAAGTRIETSDGPVAVETLVLGDCVITVDGGQPEPIIWIGQRTVLCDRQPAPETVWPVRISAGAFGENVPGRELYLSPDHAVFVNAVLVPVKLLVNGTSIVQVRTSSVTYYHVELLRHAVILAEGLPVESYLDTGDRTNFHQAGAAIRLFPDFAARLAPNVASVWEVLGAAPLVLAGAELQAARQAVMRQAAMRGQGAAR
jgi:T5SS/PEP-CTERM-associated repeat protein